MTDAIFDEILAATSKSVTHYMLAMLYYEELYKDDAIRNFGRSL